MNISTLHEQLVKIQQTLKAPKGQYNSFSKFNYRSCEDILEATKPLLGELSLIISDEVVNIGNFNYVKAMAVLSNGKEIISTTAFAKEAEVQTGMQAAQLTGSTSSYARKYALNGLFCIDDTKDADTIDNRDSANIAKAGFPDDVEASQGPTNDLGSCPKCHAPNMKYKTGKVGCSKFCWRQ